ncbi:Hypothetical predicted protein [Prunus dulcis]|uniref:Uncharacterized protein n=1 Tax=Prunus dulcis TaxID=3755 RepID=A0A5E4G9Y0_PRUDU|nr:Hypothetical predicted protein [Prunus dulcis]
MVLDGEASEVLVSRLFWEAWDSWTPPRVAMFWSWEGFDSSAKDENARKGKKTKRLSCINRRKEEEEDDFDFNFGGGHLRTDGNLSLSLLGVFLYKCHTRVALSIYLC